MSIFERALLVAAFAGCTGDDVDFVPNDAAIDASVDATIRDSASEDSAFHFDALPDQEAGPSPWRLQVANALCTRLQNCCNASDAGPFDFAACKAQAYEDGWHGSNAHLGEVEQNGNVTLDQTSAQACLAGIATLSCPIIASKEFKTVTDNCYAAVTGKLAVASACARTIECKTGEYCSDAGTCTLLADGGPCATSEQCAYRAWQNPPQFCDQNVCRSLRTDDAGCSSDNECVSAICNGTCQTTKSLVPLCDAYRATDAGPG